MFIEVIVPGPWWHTLTYESEESCPRGVRLSVPLRGRSRVAFASGRCSEYPPPGDFRIQKVEGVLDPAPVMGWELFETAERLGKHYLCGLGEALKAVLPGRIISGSQMGPYPENGSPEGVFREEFCDHPDQEDRFRLYAKLINDNKGRSLVVFPEKESAKRFWKALPQDIRQEGLCWLSNSDTASMAKWEKTRRGEVRLVVGSPAAVFAPLPSLDIVIVDDEGNPSFRSMRFPFIHSRIAAGSRAQICGSLFLTGAGVPSSRSFQRYPRRCMQSPGRRVIFSDIGRSKKMSVTGVQYPLSVCESTLKRTRAAVERKKNVLWILDRKGYAGGVNCEECGRAITCPSCGLPLRWDDSDSLMRCGFCGISRPVTDICPHCGGLSLQGAKPGLEGLLKIGEKVVGKGYPVFTWHADIRQKAASREKIARGLSTGGLVVGSRKALELCDVMPVHLICWMDADAAVNAPFFDSRSTAFRMIWESAWRGREHSTRNVIVQSRIPGSGWQKGLSTGWHHFWKMELAERKELGLPPWMYLLEISGLGGRKAELKEILVSSGYESLDPGPAEDILWVRSKTLSLVRKTLEPFYRITGSGKGFPRIKLWAE